MFIKSLDTANDIDALLTELDQPSSSAKTVLMLFTKIIGKSAAEGGAVALAGMAVMTAAAYGITAVMNRKK